MLKNSRKFNEHGDVTFLRHVYDAMCTKDTTHAKNKCWVGSLDSAHAGNGCRESSKNNAQADIIAGGPQRKARAQITVAKRV